MAKIDDEKSVEATGGETALRRIHVLLLLVVVIVFTVVVYSLIVKPKAPRTKAERDIWLYEDLVERNPKDLNLKLQLGQAYLNAGEYKLALGVYKEINRIDPKQTDAKLALGITYQQLGDHASAVKIYREVAKAQPKNSVLKLALARAYYELGDYEQALQIGKELMALKMPEPDLYFLVGSIYEKQGRKALAKQAYQAVYEYDPSSLEAGEAIKRLEN